MNEYNLKLLELKDFLLTHSTLNLESYAYVILDELIIATQPQEPQDANS